MVKKDIALCLFKLGSENKQHITHTHCAHAISVEICAGLQTEKGVHHCPGSNEVHLSRFLEDGL